MRLPSDPSPSTPYAPMHVGPKTCPACLGRFARTPEFWSRRLVTRNATEEDEDGTVRVVGKKKVSVWSSYCRDCSRDKKKEDARIRRSIARLPESDRMELEVMRRGECACCGRQKNKRGVLDLGKVGREGKVIVCTSCLEFLTKADFSLAFAKHLWFQLRSHISEELALDAMVAVRCPGRPRQWHAENPNIPSDAPHHMNCLISEREWRPVVKWLAALTNV